MTTVQQSDRFDHPRATWLDPSSGQVLSQQSVLQAASRQQAVLLGEAHTTAEIHRWQLQVLTVLHHLQPELVVGFEMFPRRLQPVLDEWTAGKLCTTEFLAKSEWETVWRYDPQLYLPIFHFCRQQNVRMVALNCYRELVTRVGKEGWDAIPESERDGLTPSVPATSAYREYLFNITGGAGPARTATAASDPSFDRFVRAQQTWDRAFACNIVEALAKAPTVVGIIGRGHLEFGHGTPYQLRGLGISNTSVLLTTSESTHVAKYVNGIANAIYQIDAIAD